MKKIVALLIVLVFTNSVLANSNIDNPKMCPSINAVKAKGVNNAIKNGKNWAAYNQKDQYDTLDYWTWGVTSNEIAHAKDKIDAILIANRSIYELSEVYGPYENGPYEIGFYCLYLIKNGGFPPTNGDVWGFANTPPLNIKASLVSAFVKHKIARQ